MIWAGVAVLLAVLAALWTGREEIADWYVGGQYRDTLKRLEQHVRYLEMRNLSMWTSSMVAGGDMRRERDLKASLPDDYTRAVLDRLIREATWARGRR